MSRFILFLILLFSAPPLVKAATLSNKHLLVDVHDETARIFLSTLGGREDIEGDEKLNLLFYDDPPSSYTVINVNKDLFIFGDPSGSLSVRPITIRDSIDAVWENDLVRVYQKVSFIKRKETGVEDGVLVSYSVENKTRLDQKIGIRLLFDTYLGEEGTQHFELPEDKTVQHESDFKGNSIPLYWLSLDEAGDSVSCLRGVVKEEVVSVPDRLVFANYKALRENLWHYRVKKRNRFDYLPYSKGDSAVALYFDPEELASGKAKEYRTILGLCGMGEYTDETIITEQEPSAEEDIQKLLPSHEVDLERIRQELSKFADRKSSLEKINSLIEQLNKILESEDTTLDEQELTELKDALKELIELRESIE